MRIACEVDVVVLVGRRPPTRILIKLVVGRAHHIERYHRHQAVWTHCTWVCGAEIGCSDKGVNVIYRLFLGLSRARLQESKKQKRRTKAVTSKGTQRKRWFEGMIYGHVALLIMVFKWAKGKFRVCVCSVYGRG